MITNSYTLNTNVVEGDKHIVIGDHNTAIGDRNIAIGQQNVCGMKGFRALEANSTSNLISIDITDVNFNEISSQLINKEILVAASGAPATGISCVDVSAITDNIGRLSTSAYDIQLNKLASSNVYVYFPSLQTIGSIPIIGDSFVIGSQNKAFGNNAHVEGYYNAVNGNYGHAEGKENIASWGSHAEGNLTQALNVCDHTEGRFTLAKDYISHAEGCATSALAAISHVAGCRSVSLPGDHCSYVWNGSYGRSYTGINTDGLSNTIPYESHGAGSFNINPKQGLSGFYVGNENFSSILGQYDLTAEEKTNNAYDEGNTSFLVKIDYYYDDIQSNETLSVKNDFYFASIELADGSNFFTINWGDGSELEVFVENASMVKHTYQKPGMYCITVSDDVKTIQIMRPNPENAGELDPTIFNSETITKLISIVSGANKLKAMPNTMNIHKPGTNSNIGYFSNLKKLHLKSDISSLNYAFFKSKITDILAPNLSTSGSTASFLRQTPCQQIHLPVIQRLTTAWLRDCSQLIAAKFDNLTRMDGQVFYNCTKLKILDLSQCETMPSLLSDTLSNVNDALSIFVKSSISANYEANEYYNQYTIIPR